MCIVPIISVIMGVYNPDEEQFIDSVKSILNQSFQDFEIIICDDGTTVNKEIFDKVKNMDSRINVLTNTSNKGLAYSLNKCIEVSKGKYIARQDADDISELDRIKKQYNFLEKNKEYSFVGSNIVLFDEKGEYRELKFHQYPQNKDFLFKSPFNHGSVMFRREVLIDNNNYRVAKETRRCEDYDLFIRIYLNNHKAYNIQENLYKFREDINTKKRRKFKYRIDEVKIRKKYFKKMGFGLERYFYIIKPVIVGLLPIFILDKIKNRYYR